MEVSIAYFRNRIYLSCTSNSKRCESSEKRKKYSKPFHMKPPFQCIHCTALHTSVRSLHTVINRYVSLCIFGCNSKYTTEPAPYNTIYRSYLFCSNGVSSIQLIVSSFFLNQLVMGSTLNDSSLLQYHDTV